MPKYSPIKAYRSSHGLSFSGWALVCLCLVSMLPTSPAAAKRLSEYDVKASYLYRFLLFIRWPEDAKPTLDKTLTIGILGKDPFGPILEKIAKRQVQGKNLSIVRLSKASEIKNCHVVYISASERRRLTHILDVARNFNVLTVSDIDNFAKLGGMIGFITQRGKIRFEINRKAPAASRLKIDANLLESAKIVR